MAYIRRGTIDSALIVVNAGDRDETMALPEDFRTAYPMIGEHSGGDYLYIPAGSAVVLAYEN